MNEEKRTLSCTDCGVLNCSKRNASYPEFCLTEKLTEKELEKVVALNSLVYSGSGEEVIKNMEQIVEKYKQAGIDKVIAEWNRQFSEWEKNKK